MSAENPNTPQPGSSLMALAAEAARLEEMIMTFAVDNDGEVDPKLDAFLSEIQSGLATKVDHYKFIMDRLETTAAMLEAQADQFWRAAQGLETVRESMKKRIKEAMVSMKSDEVTGHAWRFKLSQGKPSLVLDPRLQEILPQEYILARTIYEADKERIRSALEAGKQVRGAELVPNHVLRSYVVKAGK